MFSESVRAAVDETMRAGQVPGMVVAVARGEEPAEWLAVGVDAGGRPLERDSLFPVASITKMATALAVLRLVDRGTLGMREEDWPTTPEGIAALLARMDQIEPGWLSPEDDAAWRADLRAQREREKAEFFEDAEKARRMWE